MSTKGKLNKYRVSGIWKGKPVSLEVYDTSAKMALSRFLWTNKTVTLITELNKQS